MTKTSTIIARSFRKIGVSAEDEPITADQSLVGLEALNAMMHGWLLAGIDVSHVDLAHADTFSLNPEFEEGTVYMLASRLSPDYQTPPAFNPDDWLRMMQAAYVVIPEAVMPPSALALPSKNWGS